MTSLNKSREDRIQNLMTKTLSTLGVEVPPEVESWLSRYTECLERIIMFPNTDRLMTMDHRYFTAEGSTVLDNNFDFDAVLKVSGDFVDDEAARYAAMIARALNLVSSGNVPESHSVHSAETGDHA